MVASVEHTSLGLNQQAPKKPTAKEIKGFPLQQISRRLSGKLAMMSERMVSQRDHVSVHSLDDERLGRYLIQAKGMPQLQLPVTSTKIGHGQSNPTYFLDDANGFRFVLRKKPPGRAISPVAHQVDREYRVLKALNSISDFPVPRVHHLCTDTSVIGSEFFIMEFVQGRVMTDANLEQLSPAERHAASLSAIETLARLHLIDIDACSLGDFGKKHDFYVRHCKTWSRIEAQQAAVKDCKTGRVLGRAHPKYDQVVEYVSTHPPSERSTLVHGDFKFDNLVLHSTEPRVIAILDWELSTIGHPLMDIVFHLSPYFHDYVLIGPAAASSSSSAMQNQPGKHKEMHELLDRYAGLTGFDPRSSGGGAQDWETAIIFHYLRGATISHGIQARTISGQASSQDSHRYFAKTKRSVDAAYERIIRLKGSKSEGGRL